jgi:hypothetical protein
LIGFKAAATYEFISSLVEKFEFYLTGASGNYPINIIDLMEYRREPVPITQALGIWELS